MHPALPTDADRCHVSPAPAAAGILSIHGPTPRAKTSLASTLIGCLFLSVAPSRARQRHEGPRFQEPQPTVLCMGAHTG